MFQDCNTRIHQDQVVKKWFRSKGHMTWSDLNLLSIFLM